MDVIWAPWRDKYITRDIKKEEGCVFCRIFAEDNDEGNFIFIRAEYAFVVLNIYPYNNGHCLIVANRHVADINDLDKKERNNMFELLGIVKPLIDDVLNPDGYNIGINLGRVAGAGFPGHIHMHLVPRWKGDVNFMPVTCETKVLSQSLHSLYRKLKDAYERRV